MKTGEIMDLKDNFNKDNVFTGLCLMNIKEFELNHILLNLRQSWGIKVNADMEEYEESENSVAFAIEDMNCFINFIDSKIPDEEITLKASFNYMFEDGVQRCKSHKSYLAIGVVGGENRVKSAILFTKIATACLQEYNMIAIYTPYNVIEADAFIDEASFIKQDFLPIKNWIYIGFIKNEGDSLSAYTIGMKAFLKDEMEILNSYEEPETLRNRLLNLAYFLIDNDTELSEDETLTLKEIDSDGNNVSLEFKVKYDKAVNGIGKTVKIERQIKK